MKKRILILGFGNPGRLDDGLGPALAEKIGQADFPGVMAESDYQLNVEHATQLAGCDAVVFADASTDAAPPFTFTRIEAEKGGPSFSSHSLSAARLLGLADELFGARPDAWMLAIRGCDFNEFGERLSPAAADNLDKAVRFLLQKIQEESL